ncbi:MAG: hypothetical protein NTV46_12155 [Verrucomicrobia bacterium]|nr:hypothetical protein [Verrucomicrobiota bacterium]
MKLIHWLPPLVVLVIVGIWIGIQRLSISAMENENAMLQKHIAAVRSLGPRSASLHTQAGAPEKLVQANGAIDWKEFAAQLAEVQRSEGTGDMRTKVHLQQRMQAMSPQEICAALDEIAALDLPAAARTMLRQVLIQLLTQKNPALAVQRGIDHLQDNNERISWLLVGALQEWAKQDVGKAATWLDQQSAAGKFATTSLDGRNLSRMRFEATLIGLLLATDPAAAARRLGALPEDQRMDVIGNYELSSVNDAIQAALAKLIRDQVPAKDQAQTFAKQAARWVAQGGYPRVTEYLDQIKASPSERIACVEQAIATTILPNNQQVTREDFDTMRAWVGTQVPDAIDSITGKALCAAVRAGDHKLVFAEAAELAVQYSQASGSDNVLMILMDQLAASGDKARARILAGKISDENRRAAILKLLE